jgi:DNA mismatch repair protein MutL
VTDIIQLLPDHIANQIAAGEVIQKPASAVKELLENAIDAGATEIKLIIMDAGKSLVQVIDNGKGMSETDARMAFERHATSKITSIDDLFRIRTMGFRGEALASIAAVAQVELKTRREEDEVGHLIEIENSVVQRQELVNTPVGTSISMKNVFFNVPARRNFLKSNTTELKNIIDEFTRVALAFPQIHFSLTSNGQQVFFLEKGSLKQRIVQLLGNNYNGKLIPIDEHTDYLVIRGFAGKPETARKSRGEQYIFVNNRFIRSAYLNHAITTAYDSLLAKETYPAYILFIDLNPENIDINVHPTKQEIKFDDEKIVYAFVQAAVKHALAQYSIAPSLDFTLNKDIQQLDAIQKLQTDDIKQKTISGSLYETFSGKNQAHKIEPSQKTNFPQMPRQQNWQSELAKLKEDFVTPKEHAAMLDFEYERRPISKEKRFDWIHDLPLLQIHNTFIAAITHQGYLLIHQQAAHERILYEQFNKAASGKHISTQRSLFPVNIELPPADAVLLNDLLPDMQMLGYMIEPFGSNAFIIQGTPADLETGNEKKLIDQVLEHYKNFSTEIKFSKREKLIRTLAWQQSIKQGKALNQPELRSLVEQLFLCMVPNSTPGGNPTYIEYQLPHLLKMFGK